jgi:hypothetical protein
MDQNAVDITGATYRSFTMWPQALHSVTVELHNVSSGGGHMLHLVVSMFDINPDNFELDFYLHASGTKIRNQNPTSSLNMPLFCRKMETRRLHGADMKKLVLVLRNDPHSSINPGGSEYDKATEAAIKKLPRRLRSNPLSSHGLLCRTHKGLDAHLIDDVWAWIKFELEVAIGRFLYPIIMSNALSREDEFRVRQLEPVVEIFHPRWTLAESSPPGIPPIHTRNKWAFQQNGCPACMLARIGSDEGALFALFAGMYGHLRSCSGDQKGVGKIKSKRLRFVRYWMRTHVNGEQATLAAYELGMELKALRREVEASLRETGQPTCYTRDSLDKPSVTTDHCLDEQPELSADISEPYKPKDWIASNPHHSKMSLTPPLDPTTPIVIEGWNNKPLPETPRASIHIQPPTSHSIKSNHHSTQSNHPTEEHTLPTLPILSRANLKRRDSVLSSLGSIHLPRPASSIYSSPSRLTLATSIASYNSPTTRSHTPRYDPLDTQEERMDKYRKMLNGIPVNRRANRGVGKRLLPKPSRGSIYSAFGEDGWEEKEKEFDEVDVTPPPSPGLDGLDEEGEDEVEDKG